MSLTPTHPMRNALLLAAALATPLVLPAEPLKGIPADVDAAIHISYDEAAKSQLYPIAQDLQKRMEKLGEQLDPAAAKRNKDLMTRLGIKTNGTHSIDLGLRVTKGATPDDAPAYAIFGVIHLDLSKASLESFAKAEGVAPVSAGGVSGWEFGKLADAVLKALGAEEAGQMFVSELKDYAVAMPQDGLLVVCPVRELAKTAASLGGKAPSFELPAEAKGLATGATVAHTRLQAGVRKIQETVDPESLKTDKVGLKDVAAVVGEDARSFLINARAGFADEAKAKLAAQQITSALAIGNLAVAESDEDDADTKFYKGEAAVFLSGITVSQEADAVAIRSAFPIDRAKVLFAKMGEKVEQMAREAAAERQAGAADQDEDAMNGAPAKAPEAPKTTK